MILPTAPSSDPAVAEARVALSDRTPIVMVVGRAGTGKSHFIRSLVEADPQYPQAVLAPTGLAAMNIGGQTVHSFFGFPPRPLIGLQEKPHWFFQRTARAINRLIIDEISMLRADVLDAMESAPQSRAQILAPLRRRADAVGRRFLSITARRARR